MPRNDKFRPINRALGNQPRFGPFPADMLIPLGASTVLSYIAHAFMGLTLIQTFFVSFWLVATWWLLTGGNAFRYLVKYSRWTKPRWIRGGSTYQPLLNHSKPSKNAHVQNNKTSRAKRPSLRARNRPRRPR